MKLGKSGTRFEISEKATRSFEISRLISKLKKSHTIDEILVKPCLLKGVEGVLGEEAIKKTQKISLSYNTVKSRKEKMSQGVEDKFLSVVKNFPYFSLQFDENTDVAQRFQLLVFVRYLGQGSIIKEELLLAREFDSKLHRKERTLRK